MVCSKQILPVSVIFLLAMMMYSIHNMEPPIDILLTISSASRESQRIIEAPFNDLLKGPYGLPADHPLLVQHIRQYLVPPSDKPLNLKSPDKDPSRGQPQEIRNILGDMKDRGFYVEAGALNGESSSNTLILEKEYGWKGLLVEANSEMYEQMLEKQRKAWCSHSCLSLTPFPNRVMFRSAGVWGKIVDKELTSESDNEYAQVQCYPLYSLLLALNTTTVDYFSLDIEGFELDVLKTIPWDKLNIKTLSVEFQNMNRKYVIEDKAERNVSLALLGMEAIRTYMESVGYKVYTLAGALNWFTQIKSDFIFYRKDIIPVKPSNYTAQ